MSGLTRIIFALAMFLLVGCEGKEPFYQEQGYVFGTLVEIGVYGEPEQTARKAMGEVMQEFQRLHNMLHAWQPSELSDLNAAFARNNSAAVSAELAAILQDAAQLSQQSHGLFNPAIGGLVQLWGFHSDEIKSVQPDNEQIEQWVKANPQMADIKIEYGKARSINKFVQADLGGYAKGYALDRAAEQMRKLGIHNALINIGGNVLALGRHGNRAWRVGIQHPRRPGALATVELRDGEAIGTSGDYQRYFMVGNTRFCHLINPDTGYPMRGVQSVTVLAHGARAGVLSDVASKPLFIAGVHGWRKAASWMNVQEVMLVDEQGIAHLTTELKKRIEFTDKNLRFQVDS